MDPATKRVAIYARVSTSDQTSQNQLLDLRRYCAGRGWSLQQEFVDDAFKGSTKNRPALDELMAFVRKRQCDCVLVWRYDRFARSVSHLVTTLEEFGERGVEFASYMEGIDTGTPQGKFFFTVIAGIAEFERELIRERIHAGLRRARANGQRLGRPGLPKNKVDAILSLRGAGSLAEIALRAGVVKSTAWKVLRAFSNPTRNVECRIDGVGVESQAFLKEKV